MYAPAKLVSLLVGRAWALVCARSQGSEGITGFARLREAYKVRRGSPPTAEGPGVPEILQ